MIKLYSLVIIAVLAATLHAQVDRETRAVWVTTNFRLDWPPPTYDAEEQQQALLDILDNIERQNLNTVYFQVRFNSTVLFASNYEPWSFYLTGGTGEDPPYDPLQFMIDESHKRGLELHAWVNTVRALGGSEWQVHNYEDHLIKKNPDWTRKVETDGKASYWLDPGLPEVREYLKKVISEIAIYYNVDGIQLDFIRYPKGGFDDDDTYSMYGGSARLDDWRRQNITSLVSVIRNDLNEIKPYLKFGVTPIGIYRNNGSYNGMEGYADVYQDSYTWLARNLVDYAAPQVYWNIDDNPKFELVAKDWVANSNGNNIIIGIASYKDDVKPETGRMIDIARDINADGVAFFRYSNIKNDYSRFYYKSLPSEMAWKNITSPPAPDQLTASVPKPGSNRIILSWNLTDQYIYKHNIKYVALFNLENEFDVLGSQNLFKLIPATRSRISFSITRPSRMKYYYAVKSINNLWNESAGQSNVVSATIPRLKSIADKISWEDKPVLIRKSRTDSYILITANTSDEITLLGMGENESIDFVNIKTIDQGLNIIRLPDNMENVKQLVIEYSVSGKKDLLNLQ